MAQHAEAERVHERIALIRLVEIHLARHGRDAEAIAVMCDSARRDGQSQHAQPGQARAILADFGIRARSGGRLQSLRRARHRRQLLALQPKPRRPD